MNTKPKTMAPPPPPASITLQDIYYVIFRHKWMSAILVAIGLACSLAVYWLFPFPYISEAILYIPYIQEATAPVEMEGNANVRSSVGRGDNILNTELEMLASLDTAEAAATDPSLGTNGLERILGISIPSNAESAYVAAAGNYILAHLKSEVPPKSDVILLHYSASDPVLAQQVLSSLIKAYKNNYKSNHLSMGFSDEFLQDQTSESKTHLDDTLKSLESEKAKLGITSLVDSKKNVTDMLYKRQDAIDQVRVDLADTQAVIDGLNARLYAKATNAPQTNTSTNLAATPQMVAPSPDIIAKYQSLNANLSAWRNEEQKLLGEFTGSNKLVQNSQLQRAAAEAAVEKFEAQNPGLVAYKSNPSGSPLGASADPMMTLRYAEQKKEQLMARFKELSSQMAAVKGEAIKLDAAEDDITKAETEKEVAEAKYKHFLTSQEQARINEGNKVSNIRPAEQPTPGARENMKILKVTGGVLGFFLALAFGLPFFIEMVLDQTFKQPMDVKARIDAPFFITIPKLNGHQKMAELKRANPVALLSANGDAKPDAETVDGMVPAANESQMAAWDERSELRPFFETLRDRLMTYFEMINLTHKPKLVAVTGCSTGAGVTSTAAGLASSLSEIGEGNVLLVDMSARDGAAHHFYKGKLACGIEEVLARGKRDHAQVQDHLYVVQEMGSGDNSLPRVMPKRFSHLLPLMKASDYDYIIFDMPPVSEISITPRLARFMDMVLLVIESEKTPREAGIRAAALLAESKTNVGLVLNKNRAYLPKRLQNT
jgi:polysaccharide biosynthesis transport protein